MGFWSGWTACSVQKIMINDFSVSESSGKKEKSSQRKRNRLQEIIDRRPSWKTDFNLTDWIPRWLPNQTLEIWESFRQNQTHRKLLYNETFTLTKEQVAKRDSYFWKYTQSLSNSWTTQDDGSFTVAIADNGFGHRMSQMAFSYMCNVIPNQRQQLVHWHDPVSSNNNLMWHTLFQDSPIIAGLPIHWEYSTLFSDPHTTFRKVNEYRQSIGYTKGKLYVDGISKGADSSAGDYQMYFDFKSSACPHWDQIRDLWLLRAAKEPSVQEFYQLLRAQLQERIKDRIASFIETNFPKDKIVVGVHIRSGNGKDDGHNHFDLVQRGDWLANITSAVQMVRKHLRMVAYSMMDPYNTGSGGGIDFNKDDYDADIDDKYRIFLATDSGAILREFRHQYPNVISLAQDRMSDGEGVAILRPMTCKDKSEFDCQVAAQEAMLMDAFILSSCDAAVAESYSNFMYTIPAAIMMAEGRAFCEGGRAALGGKYTLGDTHDRSNILGSAGWWQRPPADIMPVRCHQGGFTARDRSDFTSVADVMHG